MLRVLQFYLGKICLAPELPERNSCSRCWMSVRKALNTAEGNTALINLFLRWTFLITSINIYMDLDRIFKLRRQLRCKSKIWNLLWCRSINLGRWTPRHHAVFTLHSSCKERKMNHYIILEIFVSPYQTVRFSSTFYLGRMLCGRPVVI